VIASAVIWLDLKRNCVKSSPFCLRFKHKNTYRKHGICVVSKIRHCPVHCTTFPLLSGTLIIPPLALWMVASPEK